MKAPRAFTSLLAPDIVRYLTVKHALGREYDGVSRVLAHIDHFLMTRGGELTPATFAGWSRTLQHLASGILAKYCTRMARGDADVGEQAVAPP